jgi:hypothetical protein
MWYCQRSASRRIRVPSGGVARAQQLPGDFPEDLPEGTHRKTVLGTLKRTLVGGPKDPTDPAVFHKLSLVAFLAWVGLGADGLSSSSYGPDEAFRAILGHQ